MTIMLDQLGAEPAAAIGPTAVTRPGRARPLRWAGARLLGCALAVYVADLVAHLSYLAAMRDLVVYRDGGLIVRRVSPAYDPHHASPLYDWTGQNGVQFTYPPFAAVIFAVASVLSWTAMRWAITMASLAALGLSLWLVFGALGYRDRPAVRPGATLGVSALALAGNSFVLAGRPCLAALAVAAVLCLARGRPRELGP